MGCISERTGALHAVISAYLSILAGLGELFMSLWAGHHEKSMSIYSIGIMAFVDCAGSVLVLTMWQCGNPQVRLLADRRREMQYSAIIGVMMIFLGMFLVVDSLQRLVHRSSMDSSMLGIIDSVIGTLCGFSLAGYKYVVGTTLDSPVIVADSWSSLCGAIISSLALLVVFVDDELWWSDASAGFASAMYTFYAGVSTLFAANAELSKLNRLHRGGPRPAPDHVKRIRKGGGTESQLYQNELPQAAVDGPAPEFDGSEEREGGGGGSSAIRFIYRLLGMEIPDGAKNSEASIKAYERETQKLLSMPSSSLDAGDEPGQTFTA